MKTSSSSYPAIKRNLLGLLLYFSVTAIAAEPGIRPFSIETMESLGKELYDRDKMAATAFDVLFAAHPKAQELPLKGWITQTDKEGRRVYFVQERDSQYSLAYVVTFPERGSPKIEDKQGAGLPDSVARRYRARRTAIASIPKFMTSTYNFEVLDAPDGKGFLVYGLAGTKDPQEVIVGGHYRITVSADGSTARQVDALSRSFLVLHKQPPEKAKASEVVGMTMSHVVSATPVETHVYLSLLHGMPLYVVTSEHEFWKVKDGRISKMKGR